MERRATAKSESNLCNVYAVYAVTAYAGGCFIIRDDSSIYAKQQNNNSNKSESRRRSGLAGAWPEAD